MNKKMKIKPTIEIPLVFLILIMGIILILNMIFMYRNPKANSMSLYREFINVVTLQKLPEYQK